MEDKKLKKTFSELPETMRNHLASPETAKQMRALLKPLDIRGEKLIKFGAILNGTDLGEFSLEQLPTLFEKNLALPPVRARQFAADIAGFRYLPIAEHLKTDVARLIREWGKNPNDFVPARAKPNIAPKAVSLPPLPSSKKPTLDEALPAAKKFQALPPPEPAQKMDDEEEIAQIKSAMKPADEEMSRLRKESAKAITRTAKLTFSSPEIETRWNKIVDSRLRDIRDRDETLAILILSKEQGGLGLASPAADKLAGIIEAEWTGLSAKLASQIKQRTISNIQTAARERQKKDELQKQKSAREHSTKVFEYEKTKAAKDNEEILVPQASLPRPLAEPKTKPPKAVLSPSSTQAQKQRITDLVPPRKLTGPIDELRAMTMKDFHRLSNNPAEAAQKIKDRIMLQKEEGFENYAKALDAWRDSEPHRLYLEILEQSLRNGKPAPESIQAKTAASTPTLTKEEFSALLSLERDLRYNA